MGARSSFLLLVFIAACGDQGLSAPDAARDSFRADQQRLEASVDGLFVDQRPTRSDRCGGGELLDLEGGLARVLGDTSEASNEYGGSIRCGGQEPLAGPQRYYSLQLEAGRAYRLELEPTFDASLYLFSACNIDVINADCSEDDGAGVRLPLVEAGGVGRVIFWPDASGPYELAVDSLSAAAMGSFELRVEAFTAADESRCTQARELSFEQDLATASGSTLGAADEFDGAIGCKTGLAFTGPQAYFSLELDGAESYRLEVEADFEAALYAFSEQAGCSADNIELDCGGIGGTVLLPRTAQSVAATRFTPPSSGRYLLAVDSLLPRVAGDFTLRILREAPQQHEACAAAEQLSLVDGYGQAVGDTTGLLDDHGALLQCAGRPQLGPQRYYRVALEARPYRIRLQPQFDAVLALGQSCQLLPVDCQSAGLTGNATRVPSGTLGSLSLTPEVAGERVIVVDSARADAAGSFTLEVIESLPAENGVCTAPASLELGKTLAGETGALGNDLSGVACESSQGPFEGPQAYYRLVLGAGQSAEVSLSPDANFDPALYAFVASTTCDASAVDAACTALVSDTPQAGAAETLLLAAVVETEYIVVVDSWSPSEVGLFTLKAALLP